MEADLHEQEAYEGVIAGYVVCTCGEQVLESLAQQTGWLCLDCFQKGERRKLRSVEIIHRGARSTIQLPTKRKTGGSKGSARTHRSADRAKIAAMRRLRALYPEMYELLYTEERIKRGLSAVPKRDNMGRLLRATETYDFDPVYAALLDRGVEVERA